MYTLTPHSLVFGARCAHITVALSRCCVLLPLSNALASIPNTARRMLRVNFDPLIVRLLREVKYFLLLGLKVPDSALEVFSRGEVRGQRVRRVGARWCDARPSGAGAQVENVYGVSVNVVHADVHDGVNVSADISKCEVGSRLASPSRTLRSRSQNKSASHLHLERLNYL